MRIWTTAAPDEAQLDGARAVYADAFGQEPYLEPPSTAEAFVDRFRSYAATRDGCRLVLAQDARDGRVIGFVLSVIAHPGDWWRERVAARLGTDRTQRRLGAACVEVVHVAVGTGSRSRGVGTAMMAAVAAEAAAPRAVLAVDRAAPAAQRLYERCGWAVIAEDFRLTATSAPARLMARDLP